jgi:hypothetical protein
MSDSPGRTGPSRALGAGGLLVMGVSGVVLALALGSAPEDSHRRPVVPVDQAALAAQAIPVAMIDPAGDQLSNTGMMLVGGMAGQPAAFVPPAPMVRRPQFQMIPFVEAHWQGLEMIELSPALATVLGIDPALKAVIADDVTPPADACLFQGGDIILSVNRVATPDLLAFIAASARVRDESHVEVSVMRKGQVFPLVLWGLQGRLGTANGETAPMIPAGSVSPHAYQGKCTGCHRIGTVGTLPMDQGDLLSRAAPPIRAGQIRLHRDRGPCTTCHAVLP